MNPWPVVWTLLVVAATLAAPAPAEAQGARVYRIGVIANALETADGPNFEAFMSGLAKMATTRKHCNVLQHIQGYFRKIGSDDDRLEVGRLVEDFRRELVPLIVPITLVRHLVRRYDIEYLRGQTYLEPHPRELMLRNHV